MRAPGALLAAALMIAAAAPRAAAQTLDEYDYENLSFRGLGLDYGRIWPNKVESTAVYSARIDLGYLGPGLRIAPSIGYWSSQLRRSELQRLVDQLNQFGGDLSVEELGTVEWSDLYINLDAHIVWTTPLAVLTYVGGGVGFHALNGQGQSIQDTFVEDLLDAITPSMDAIGGVEFEPVSRLRVYGEARFTLMSDIRYGGVRVGAALMLPPRPATSSPSQPGANP